MVETKDVTKEYLLQVFYAIENIKYKNKELEKLIAKQAPKDVSVPNLEKVGSFSRKLKSAKTVCNEIIKLQEEIMELKNKVTKAVERINKLRNPQHKTVLLYRYIYGKGWREISDLMRVSERRIFYLHREALKVF